jgi:hypothetical protein
MANPLSKYSADFTAFCRDMVVQIGGKFRRLGDVWDDKQRCLIEKVAPSAHAVIRGDVPPIKRCYVNATKGYGKDMLCTLFLMYVLMFAQRPTRAQLLANKQAQANEPLDILKGILWADGPLNRMAAQVIELQNYRVVSHKSTGRPESVIEVLASDRMGSGIHGSRPDVLVCNEVSHIEDWDYFETAGDNLAKCPHGFGWFLSNAGHLGTPAHAWHERVLTDPLFDCTVINTPAPWIDREVLAHKQRTSPPSRFNQYYYGVWSSPLGDVLPREQIERAIKLKGPHSRCTGPYRYIAAADLSSTTNRSGICVFAIASDGRPIELAFAGCWNPQEYQDRSDFIETLQYDIQQLHERFNLELVAFDQFESFLLIDLCHRLGIRSFLYRAGSRNFDKDRTNGAMKAEFLFRAFQEEAVSIYRHEQLLLDLAATSLVTKISGTQLVFGRDADGSHADLADAFSLGNLLSLQFRSELRRNMELYGNETGPLPEVWTA